MSHHPTRAEIRDDRNFGILAIVLGLFVFLGPYAAPGPWEGISVAWIASKILGGLLLWLGAYRIKGAIEARREADGSVLSTNE